MISVVFYVSEKGQLSFPIAGLAGVAVSLSILTNSRILAPERLTFPVKVFFPQ